MEEYNLWIPTINQNLPYHKVFHSPLVENNLLPSFQQPPAPNAHTFHEPLSQNLPYEWVWSQPVENKTMAWSLFADSLLCAFLETSISAVQRTWFYEKTTSLLILNYSTLRGDWD